MLKLHYHECKLLPRILDSSKYKPTLASEGKFTMYGNKNRIFFLLVGNLSGIRNVNGETIYTRKDTSFEEIVDTQIVDHNKAFAGS